LNENEDGDATNEPKKPDDAAIDSANDEMEGLLRLGGLLRPYLHAYLHAQKFAADPEMDYGRRARDPAIDSLCRRVRHPGMAAIDSTNDGMEGLLRDGGDEDGNVQDANATLQKFSRRRRARRCARDPKSLCRRARHPGIDYELEYDDIMACLLRDDAESSVHYDDGEVRGQEESIDEAVAADTTKDVDKDYKGWIKSTTTEFVHPAIVSYFREHSQD